MTLSQMGLFESLGKHNKMFSHWNVPDGMNAAEVLKNASTCDNYLLSANGLAETGEIINIDGTGNRVSSSLYGHKRVWFVVGSNKIAPTYDEALWRARNIAAARPRSCSSTSRLATEKERFRPKGGSAVRKKFIPLSLALCLTLSGCGGNVVLERSYSVSAPHSEVYWENEGADTLRADSYQDLVNALLLLLGEHSEEGVVRIYSEEDAAAMAEQACKEVQEETALGAYLLDYISYTDTQERAYYEMHVRLGYRRTAEEQAGIVTATSTEALPDLLRLTAREGALSRIAVRFTYFTADRDGIRDMVRSVQEEVDPGFTEPWQVNFYPDTDDVGIVEVVLREA